jgi:hypothetical protein
MSRQTFPAMNNSRRDFIKTVGVGAAGMSLGGGRLASAADSRISASRPEAAALQVLEDAGAPRVFPFPREAEFPEGSFRLSEKTVILVPQRASEQDRFLARMLVSELAERHGLVLPIEHVSTLSNRSNFILLGSAANPLAKSHASANRLSLSARSPGPEGYFLKVTPSAIAVLGSDDPGAFYGLQSLRQLIHANDGTEVPCVTMTDRPHMPFRGIRIYCPYSMAYYRRLVRDFAAYFKYNKLIVQMDAAMRLERHPEINVGWMEYSTDMHTTRRTRGRGPKGETQTGGTTHPVLYDKDQIADMVQFARQHHIEVIPEIQSLSHSYYLLSRHRELAEIQDAEWPDTYCPSNPGSYDLYFAVLDEYIEVMKPRIVHIGHDEWRMPIDACERCRGKDYSDLFVQDVRKIHDYLKRRGIRTAMWGDHLAETHAGKGPQPREVGASGHKYFKPGAVPPEKVKAMIPKDILVFNWSWSEARRPGEKNTQDYSEWGFEQVFGNFGPQINDFARRSQVKGLIGGVPSVWSTRKEYTLGRKHLFELLGCANLLWSVHYPEITKLGRIVQSLVPSVRLNLEGRKPPSRFGDPIVPLSIVPALNAAAAEGPLGMPLDLLRSGRVQAGRQNFTLASPRDNGGFSALVVGCPGRTALTLPARSRAIPINRDVSSLLFLHACARPGRNFPGYMQRFALEDTADLLGWYRVIYKDGYVHSVPLRYGIHLREWRPWGTDPSGQTEGFHFDGDVVTDSYCFEADRVNCSSARDRELLFFSHEWINPRWGKEIVEIHLEGSRQFQRYNGAIMDSNAIVLAALSCVPKRDEGRVSARRA